MGENNLSESARRASSKPGIILLQSVRRLVAIPGVSSQAVWFCLALTIAVLVMSMIPGARNLWFHLPELFWDARVYDRAVASFSIGEHPSANASAGFPFVYLPISLYLFKNIFATPLGFYVVPLINFILVIVTGLRCASPRVAIMACAVWAAAIFNGYYSLLTGNIAISLHLVLLLYFLGYANTKASHTNIRGSLLIAIAAAIKPYMLASLVLFWLDRRASLAQKLSQTAITLIVLSVIYGASFLLLPELTADYISVILKHAVATKDLGVGFFLRFHEMGFSRGESLVGHAVVSMSLVAVYYFRSKFGDARSIAILYGLVVLMNPRLKPYDFMPALLPLIAMSAQTNGLLFRTAFWLSVGTAGVFAYAIATG